MSHPSSLDYSTLGARVYQPVLYLLRTKITCVGTVAAVLYYEEVHNCEVDVTFMF